MKDYVLHSDALNSDDCSFGAWFENFQPPDNTPSRIEQGVVDG
jgi:hypothetical protein